MVGLESQHYSALSDTQIKKTVRTSGFAKTAMFYRPVIKQDVRFPNLAIGKSDARHSGIFRDIPFKVMIEPVLEENNSRNISDEC